MTEQSPVVPSVGAVPVEVPEEAVEAAARALSLCTAADAGLDVFARLAVEAAYPLIAARVRGPNCEHTIRARMSDQPGPCTSECGKPADQTCLQWACRKAGADLAAPAEQDGQR